MTLPYRVLPYTIDDLQETLAEKARRTLDVVTSKPHTRYFRDYFDKIDPHTIVVENDYIDRHYLEDYEAYCVRCFREYPRKCTRLHFFKSSFSQDEFQAFLEGRNDSLLEKLSDENYAGFVVVKPLPETIIGRTCLRTYDSAGDRRQFPAVREYRAHLYGLTLKVQTLPFQEQDRIAAACATSALWSAFHGTHGLFDNYTPSPVEITRAGTAFSRIETRTLPNCGLTKFQMADAIRSVNLEPFVVKVRTNEYVLKSTSYAYLAGGVPVLLVVDLHDTSSNFPYEEERKHAVTVAGYSLGLPNAVPHPGTGTGFLLRASRIDRMYAHDDQVGPFARMIFDGVTVKVPGPQGRPIDLPSLSTSFPGDKGIGYMRAVPDIIMLPVYHKIRIPFDAVHDALIPFDGLIELLRQAGRMNLESRLEWDIRLTTVERVKGNISPPPDLTGEYRTPDLTGEYRSEVLLHSMPRFLWQASAVHQNRVLLDLLFDATDIEQGDIFHYAIEYDREFSARLRGLARAKSGLMEAFRPYTRKFRISQRILKWFFEPPQAAT